MDKELTSHKDLRITVASVALGEVGLSEPLKYGLSTLPPSWSFQLMEEYCRTKSWCGFFALWCLKQAGLAETIFWKDGAGFLLVAPHSLKMVAVPEVGDIAYFMKNQHHAVVVSSSDGVVCLVNGNGKDGEVTHTETPINNVSNFFSIGRLLTITPDGET